MFQTNRKFTYGKFEIRAALPKGKMLRPNIELIPGNGNQWPRTGWINIASNNQTQAVNTDIHFQRDSRTYLVENVFNVEENLNDFNVYGFDWTESELKWLFNGRVLRTFNITKELENNYNPFSQPFYLRIYLGVGGILQDEEFFPGQTLFESDSEKWNCSSFIIDYVRIYQDQLEESNLTIPVEHNNASSSEICDNIMLENQNKNKNTSWNLIFSDEFENETIDEEMWRFFSNDCQGIFKN